MTIIVIGGLGYLGRSVVERIVSETNLHTVIVDHRASIAPPLGTQDCEIYQSVSELVRDCKTIDGKTTIINCGGYSPKTLPVEKIMKSIELNVIETFEDLQFLAASMTLDSYILISSIYAKQPCDSPYGKIKVLSEKLCRSLAAEFNFKLQILRAGTIFGGEDHCSGIAKIVDAALNDQNADLNLESQRNFIYLTDFSNSILRLLELPGGVYQLIGSYNFDYQYVIKLVSEMLQKDLRDFVSELDNRAVDYQLTPIRIENIQGINLEVETPFDEAIRDMIIRRTNT